uniref:BBIP1 protein n=2 Tax=Strigidae TaxID=30459 RepID=A0A8D0EPN3_STROC
KQKKKNKSPQFRGEEERGSGGAAMPEGKAALREVLPKQGQLSVEDAAAMVLCKPKVLPLKSVSLEKLEALQRAALEAARPPEGAPPPRP